MGDRKRLGEFGERIATRYLKKRGYRILETNFRCSVGEIDAIARKDDYLVFVEVRTKRDLGFGTPEESITQAKKERLMKLAESYIQSHRDKYMDMPWRIDVVAIQLSGSGKVSRIELIENAV